jgi:methionine synthase II (cobalamin-independent)
MILGTTKETKSEVFEMPSEQFGCLATMIGSLPHIDATQACQRVWRFLKGVPSWPQLPKRSFLENMYVQYSQGFPGIVVGNDKIFVDRTRDLDKPLEQLYSAYLENNIDMFPVTRDYAAGLYEFLTYEGMNVRAVKGQITGPISWGLTVADNTGRAIAYDETLADAAAKLLKLKAGWMEKELRQISPKTVIFVDEPSLHSIGSAFFALSNEKVVSLINEVFSGVQGLKGIHCCGKSDWSIVLSTNLDILGFDTYNYAETLPLYPDKVKKFLGRGGVIAWGIVPVEEALFTRESPASLQERLEEAIAPLTRKGIEIPFRQVIDQSLITPSCGLPGVSPEGADYALELLSNLSDRIRKKYT